MFLLWFWPARWAQGAQLATKIGTPFCKNIFLNNISFFIFQCYKWLYTQINTFWKFGRGVPFKILVVFFHHKCLNMIETIQDYKDILNINWLIPISIYTFFLWSHPLTCLASFWLNTKRSKTSLNKCYPNGKLLGKFHIKRLIDWCFISC